MQPLKIGSFDKKPLAKHYGLAAVQKHPMLGMPFHCTSQRSAIETSTGNFSVFTPAKLSAKPAAVNATSFTSNYMRMKKRLVPTSSNCAALRIFAPCATRKPDPRCTIPGRTGQETVRTNWGFIARCVYGLARPSHIIM